MGGGGRGARVAFRTVGENRTKVVIRHSASRDHRPIQNATRSSDAALESPADQCESRSRVKGFRAASESRVHATIG